MRALLFLCLFTWIYGVSSAQPRKGEWQISAGAGFDFTKSNTDSFPINNQEKDPYSYRITLGAEYFFSNRFSVGLSPFWGESSYKMTGEANASIGNSASELKEYYLSGKDELYMREFGLEASVKYYLPITRNFYFTVNGFVSYSHSKFTDRFFAVGNEVDSDKGAIIAAMLKGKGQSYAVGIMPGFSYYFTNRWGANLQFLSINYLNDDNRKEEDWSSVVVIRTDPFLPSFTDQPSPLNITSGIAPLDFERRKNDFDVNWACFRLSVSYKF